ncbi:hypothetical protein LFU01_02560 [Lysinibacillus fusiformis]|nr:malate dehydrogenase [Bacillus sp. B14905]QAS55271.1 hypothetical protein LSP_02165 [Lysinibacillus sphaericus]RDV33490.1 hypothetical protein C7B90_08095 [Lysinibacillus fusiformis]GED61804.1 hypothetical protein LFU01_02560 [Lysinibacillus fusiformis]
MFDWKPNITRKLVKILLNIYLSLIKRGRAVASASFATVFLFCKKCFYANKLKEVDFALRGKCITDIRHK